MAFLGGDWYFAPALVQNAGDQEGELALFAATFGATKLAGFDDRSSPRLAQAAVARHAEGLPPVAIAKPRKVLAADFGGRSNALHVRAWLSAPPSPGGLRLAVITGVWLGIAASMIVSLWTG